MTALAVAAAAVAVPGAASGQTNTQQAPPARPAAPPVGQTTTTAAEAPFTRAEREIAREIERPGPYDHFAFSYNPLGLLVGGRISLNFEWSPVEHHALVISPHFVHTTANVATAPGVAESLSFTGFGSELGYRYYTGHRGMNGIFFGPSLIFGAFHGSVPSGSRAFTNAGLAIDIGVEEILWDHFVVGAGAGLQLLTVSHDFGDLPTGPSMIAASGFKPRLLLEAGYGF
jgi:hypothetical protein